MSTKMGASVSYSNGPPNFADARAVQLIATHSVISSDLYVCERVSEWKWREKKNVKKRNIQNSR